MGGTSGRKRLRLRRLDRQTTGLRKGELATPPGYEPGRGGHGSATSIRRASHLGRQIELHTTYEIFLDGEPVHEQIMALDDGTVHYHGLPNYSFHSALELVRRIVERSMTTPIEDELNPSTLRPRRPRYQRRAGGRARKGGHHHDPP